jgi:hypothetical protein
MTSQAGFQSTSLDKEEAINFARPNKTQGHLISVVL